MPTRTPRNAVHGCPGWFYGLLVRNDETRTVTFSVHNTDTRERIDDLHASAYRTTTLARRMGDSRRGYQHVAQLAIRAKRDGDDAD